MQVTVMSATKLHSTHKGGFVGDFGLPDAIPGLCRLFWVTLDRDYLLVYSQSSGMDSNCQSGSKVLPLVSWDDFLIKISIETLRIIWLSLELYIQNMCWSPIMTESLSHCPKCLRNELVGICSQTQARSLFRKGYWDQRVPAMGMRVI